MLDKILATMTAPNFNIDELIVFPAKPWDFAIMIGQAASMIENGYPDAFDAMDFEDYAQDVYRDAKRARGHEATTYRQMFLDLQCYQGIDPVIAQAIK